MRRSGSLPAHRKYRIARARMMSYSMHAALRRRWPIPRSTAGSRARISSLGHEPPSPHAPSVLTAKSSFIFGGREGNALAFLSSADRSGVRLETTARRDCACQPRRIDRRPVDAARPVQARPAHELRLPHHEAGLEFARRGRSYVGLTHEGKLVLATAQRMLAGSRRNVLAAGADVA